MITTVAPSARRWSLRPELLWAAAGLMMALAILARAAITELGVRSFGRLWPYYINYFDFGFIRRGLFGTLLHPLLPLLKQGGLAKSTYALGVLFLLILTAVAVFFFRRLEGGEDGKRGSAAAILFLSPAFLTHFAYSTGNLDIVLVGLALVILIFAGNVAIVVLACAIAMFVHEIFLVACLPAVVASLYLGRRPGTAAVWGIPHSAIAAPVVCLASFAIITKCGLWTGSRDLFNAKMAAISPDLLLRDGWFELTSDTKANVELTRPQLLVPTNWLFMSLPIAYVVILFFVFVPRRLAKHETALYAAAAFAPLLLLVFGGDAYRWISFAAVGALLMGLYVTAQRSPDNLFTRRPLTACAVLLPWVLVGPIGSAGVDRPFPMLQFALERFF